MAATAGNEPRGSATQGSRNGGFTGTPEVPVKPGREASELGAMMRRMTAALARRAASGDLEALVELDKLAPVLALETMRAALVLNQDQGYSWAQIALRLGISKRAVIGRWAKGG